MMLDLHSPESLTTPRERAGLISRQRTSPSRLRLYCRCQKGLIVEGPGGVVCCLFCIAGVNYPEVPQHACTPSSLVFASAAPILVPWAVQSRHMRTSLVYCTSAAACYRLTDIRTHAAAVAPSCASRTSPVELFCSR